jgi:hypothetical protein
MVLNSINVLVKKNGPLLRCELFLKLPTTSNKIALNKKRRAICGS